MICNYAIELNRCRNVRCSPGFTCSAQTGNCVSATNGGPIGVFTPPLIWPDLPTPERTCSRFICSVFLNRWWRFLLASNLSCRTSVQLGSSRVRTGQQQHQQLRQWWLFWELIFCAAKKIGLTINLAIFNNYVGCPLQCWIRDRINALVRRSIL